MFIGLNGTLLGEGKALEETSLGLWWLFWIDGVERAMVVSERRGRIVERCILLG